MGIDLHNLHFLAHAQDLGARFERTLAIGRQALFVDEHDLAAHRMGRALPPLVEPQRSAGTPRYFEPLARQWLGADVADAVDASAYEGARLVHDMNLPWPSTSPERGSYDAVLDFGCLEHVFDFPTAWRNCVDLCRVGGHVLHALPANNLSGHGFYQFSPELFFNLYQHSRGFALKALYFALKADGRHWWRVADPVNVNRRVNLRNGQEVYMLVLAQKLVDVVPTTAPQQSDYAQDEWAARRAIRLDDVDLGLARSSRRVARCTRRARRGPTWRRTRAGLARQRADIARSRLRASGRRRSVAAARLSMSRAGVPRVLLVCDRLDVRGGVERFVCTLATHLAGQDLCVGVASVATDRSGVAYALPDTVEVLSGPVPAPSAAGPRGWRLLRAQWHARQAIGDAIARFAPDVIVLNGVVTACAVLWRRPAVAARSIVCDHNHFGARSAFWQRLRAKLYPEVAAVVSLTHADRAKFAALNPRTSVIPNASDLATLETEVVRPVPGASPIVLAVGRLVAQKGIDLLLRAWVTVQRAAPNARLHIVGEGPLQAQLQALARTLHVDGSVVWLPPTDDIAALYRSATVFVLPSRYEGMPLSLLEAQALGVPAVAFDCPTGPADILRPATGVLVPAFDVTALAAALLRLLGDADLRARMGEAAVVRSRRAFAMEHHLRRWSDLVWQVIGQVTVDEAT